MKTKKEEVLVVTVDECEMLFASVEEFKRYINTENLPIGTTKRYVRMARKNFEKSRMFYWSEYEPSKI